MKKRSNIELAREYLDDNHLKMAFYAEAVGRSRQWVYDLLRGQTTPSIHDALKLEKATKGLLKVTNW
jgi:transcriptional regulator with XRE-family HTH domain